MELRGLTLDRFQTDAIAALQAGHSVLVCAPTGTGKTLVADWLVEDALARGKEVIYTAPIKALSNQKYRDYCRLFGDESVGLVTGDLVIRRDARCRVMTTEILRNILLSGERLPDLAGVIIDEIHFLDDRERGTTWEEVLLYLPREVQVLGLSATLSNLDEFSAWLESVRERKVVVIEERRRTVPLTYMVATREAGLREPHDMYRAWQRWARQNAAALRHVEQEAPRHGRQRRRELTVGKPTRHGDVFRLLHPDALPYLYFVFSRKQAESFARGLAQRLPPEGLLEEHEWRQVDAELRAFVAAGNGLEDDVAELYVRGVAFHHAGLAVPLKALVERLYERKLIKVLYCTGTFALGINMPARAAVFEGLERFDGREMIRLPTREFFQMAGRAGRRGMDESGLVVVRADMETYEATHAAIEGYLHGRYEPVRSSFSLSFNSVVHLLHRNPPERIRWLVDRSFLAFHRNRVAREQAAHADSIEEKLIAAGWDGESAGQGALKKEVKQLRKLRAESSVSDSRTWEEFEAKVTFLKGVGYIGDDGTFNAGARVLMHLQIQEIFATELFLQGVFESLTPSTLFGVLCGMCHELPRGVFAPVAREYRGLAKQIDVVRNSHVVVEAERLSNSPVVWDPQMISFGRLWAEGRSLNELLLHVQSVTDISGDLVGAFRRARELGNQLREVWAELDTTRASALRDLIRSVSRGEVEVLD